MATAQRQCASHVASTIGDLITQEDMISSATITDMMNAGETIIKPFSATPLKVRNITKHHDADSQLFPRSTGALSKGGLGRASPRRRPSPACPREP